MAGKPFLELVFGAQTLILNHESGHAARQIVELVETRRFGTF